MKKKSNRQKGCIYGERERERENGYLARRSTEVDLGEAFFCEIGNKYLSRFLVVGLSGVPLST